MKSLHTHLHRTLQAIKAEGMKAGVAINPHTNIDLLEDVINDIDLVCIMSVNQVLEDLLSKTRMQKFKIKALITRTELQHIEVDGGVTNKMQSNL
jgi:ribulose-phosphate 3-epimerase